jgi:pyruvate dehydrogenase kinase 2/3/4
MTLAKKFKFLIFMLSHINDQLWSRIRHFASFPPTGVSIKQMVEFGRNPSQGTLLRASQFLADELPIRLAKRVLELDTLPHGLSDMPSIIRVKNWYAESFKELSEFPQLELPTSLKEKYRASKVHHSHHQQHHHQNTGVINDLSNQSKSHIIPSNHAGNNLYYSPFEESDLQKLPYETLGYNRDFTRLIEAIKRRHDPVVTTIAWGIVEWKRSHNKRVINSDIQDFLDRFYLSRIGIRVLIGQHIALQKPAVSTDYVGIICTRTRIHEVIQDAIDNARFICEDHYGVFDAPEVILQCDKNLEFMYIPSHLHHMIFELLKNSLRAVVELYGTEKEDHFPPVIIKVTENERVCLKNVC